MEKTTSQAQSVADILAEKILMREKLLADAKDYAKAARSKARDLNQEIIKLAAESGQTLLRLSPMA